MIYYMQYDKEKKRITTTKKPESLFYISIDTERLKSDDEYAEDRTERINALIQGRVSKTKKINYTIKKKSAPSEGKRKVKKLTKGANYYATQRARAEQRSAQNRKIREQINRATFIEIWNKIRL